MGRAYRFKLIFITMTHKVYNKCLYTWMRDIDTHVERIEVYDGTTFYPTKDSEEWNEDTITFEYRQMYTNSTYQYKGSVLLFIVKILSRQ